MLNNLTLPEESVYEAHITTRYGDTNDASLHVTNIKKSSFAVDNTQQDPYYMHTVLEPDTKYRAMVICLCNFVYAYVKAF